MFSSYEVHLMDERVRKNAEMAPFNSNYGAGTGSRTLISSLGRIHNSRYTIPATFLLYHTYFEISNYSSLVVLIYSTTPPFSRSSPIRLSNSVNGTLIDTKSTSVSVLPINFTK